MRKGEDMSEDIPAWRKLLAQLTENNPAERQRAASELGVSTVTLVRWMTGESRPRTESLQKLPSVFPLYSAALNESIRNYLSPGSVGTPSVPTELTERVFEALATSGGTFSSWSICNMLLLKAIEQLDPSDLGMEISVVQCVPPKQEQLVRSACERIGVGSSPWSSGVKRRVLFLGAESLAGYVIGRGEPASVGDMRQEGSLPVRPGAYEKSAAAHPLLRRGRIAGCLLVSSTQTDFFTPASLALIEQYTNRIALAFADDEFYRQSEISLHFLPLASEQDQHHQTTQFRERIAALRQANAFRLGEAEAEIRVLQDMEDELIR